MPDDNSISEETLKELLGRAAELDDDARQRIDLPRARAIANEVGISTAAWDAAIQERSIGEPGAFTDFDDGKLHGGYVVALAALALLVGGMMGFISRAGDSRADVVTGGCAVAGTL